MNITDYLNNIQNLTKQNLEILQAINDSFFTKKEHITTAVGNRSFAIPSFISLENKVNALQEGFNNLVNAPETGEAYFNFDGNSKAIEMRSFNTAPEKIKLEAPTKFEVKTNNIFKDFLSPVPYVNFNLTALPNDITTVRVKKVIPLTSELRSSLISFIEDDKSTGVVEWADVYKILSVYKAEQDYTEYETDMDLPVRRPTGSGNYVVSEIISDEIDANLEEHIKIKLRSTNLDETLYRTDLTYTLFEDTIVKNLRVGDYLTTYNKSTKLKVTEVFPLTNTITVKVMHGEYLNLVPSADGAVQDLSILRYFSEVEMDESKYLHVPLEEDQYVLIWIAPVNNRLRIQAPWGTGVVLNTFGLKLNGEEDGESFNTYYQNNVNNIGDVLYEMTSILSGNTLTKLSSEDFEAVRSEKPEINTDNLVVTQINKHLDDTESVKNIRSLYSQKKQYESELESIQTEIDRINVDLSSISFDDTTGQRSALTAALSTNNQRKNEITTSIIKIVNNISQFANNSEIPIENAKYRIRGYYDITPNGTEDKRAEHIRGIEVQYRYKNSNKEQGNALTINDKFLFSDWNIMDGFNRWKLPESKASDNTYSFKLQGDNSTKNEPSFNQIDIPISQGESVDLKLRVIYDYGYPFVTMTSEWSDIVNVEFPAEYMKNIQILDIIEENNNDIETNRFKNILQEQGIPDHVGDKIMDQDIVYFHKPENISSGFYTNERRIIPLKDKLTDLDNIVRQLQDELEGSNAKSIKVSVSVGDSTSVLEQNVNTIVSIAGPNELQDGSDYLTDGVYSKYSRNTNTVYSTVLKLIVKNVSSHTVKLYPIFPGPRSNSLDTYVYKDTTHYLKTVTSSSESHKEGVWTVRDETNNNGTVEHKIEAQRCNQFLTFRLDNPWTGEPYYGDGQQYESKLLSTSSDHVVIPAANTNISGVNSLMVMYPKINNEYSLCVESDATNAPLILNPDESVVVPIVFEYQQGSSPNWSGSKTMSFDIRTSLYNDPFNYTFTAAVKANSTDQDKLLRNVKKDSNYTKYNTTVKA